MLEKYENYIKVILILVDKDLIYFILLKDSDVIISLFAIYI